MGEEKILLSAMHAAVSLSYVDSELARLETRKVLKDAAGWPHDPGDEERIRTLHAEVEAHERRFAEWYVDTHIHPWVPPT